MCRSHFGFRDVWAVWVSVCSSSGGRSVLWHWSYSVLVQSGVTRGQEEGSIRSSVKEKVKVWIHSVFKSVCVCVWGLKRTTHVIPIPLCLYISMWLSVSRVGAWLFHTCVSMKEWVCIISVGERGDWKVVGLVDGSSGAEIELTDIQEELVVTLPSITKLPRGSNKGRSSNWLIIRQVALLRLLEKGRKERGWKFTLIQYSMIVKFIRFTS